MPRFALCLLFPLLAAAQQPSELVAGETIYLSQCSFCHGQKGEGGRGAPLTRAKLRHAPDEAALAQVIRRGVPDSDMPGTALSPEELKQVAAFVRSLGRVSSAPAPGDPKTGEKIYSTKGGCARCHMINGQGGIFGPDLSAIGGRRNVEYLRRALTDPGADIPQGFVQVRTTSRDGKSITGARVNEDTFSVQLRDVSGKVHSFWKSDLQSLRKDLDKSPMPSYRGALTAAELDDVVAYLAGLQENGK